MKRLPTGQVVYDPCGTVTIEPFALAARPPKLAEVRLGVLDNSKWNASRLLKAVVALLETRHRLGPVTFYKKESFSRVATDALLGRISAENDLVVTAVGD